MFGVFPKPCGSFGIAHRSGLKRYGIEKPASSRKAGARLNIDFRVRSYVQYESLLSSAHCYSRFQCLDKLDNHLPACASILYDGSNSCFTDLKVGGESVFVDQPACVFTQDSQFAPIDLERSLISPQWQFVGIARGMDFTIASGVSSRLCKRKIN